MVGRARSQACFTPRAICRPPRNVCVFRRLESPNRIVITHGRDDDVAVRMLRSHEGVRVHFLPDLRLMAPRSVHWQRGGSYRRSHFWQA